MSYKTYRKGDRYISRFDPRFEVEIIDTGIYHDTPAIWYLNVGLVQTRRVAAVADFSNTFIRKGEDMSEKLESWNYLKKQHYTRAEAIQREYPELLQKHPELALAVNTVLMAEMAIEQIMTQLINKEEDS